MESKQRIDRNVCTEVSFHRLRTLRTAKRLPITDTDPDSFSRAKVNSLKIAKVAFSRADPIKCRLNEILRYRDGTGEAAGAGAADCPDTPK
jgi:hypothetical protein